MAQVERNNCFCEVCKQRRIAAAEVDKLNHLMIMNPASERHLAKLEETMKQKSDQFDVAQAEEERKAAEHEKQYVARLQMNDAAEAEKKRHEAEKAAEEAQANAARTNHMLYLEGHIEQLEAERDRLLDYVVDHHGFNCKPREGNHVDFIIDQLVQLKAAKAKFLKQDKQFKELAQENQNHQQALILTINITGAKIEVLEKQLKLAEHEKEYWRLRAEMNAKPVALQQNISFVAATNADLKATKEYLENLYKNKGGCA